MKNNIIRSIWFTLLIFSSSQSSAQEVVASSDYINYYRCSDVVPKDQIQSIFGIINGLVETYNKQDDVDIQMEDPSLSQCYLSEGKEESMLAGMQGINFYIDSDHFRCSVAGNCTGDRAGYQASGIAASGGRMTFTANTNRADDMVQRCTSSSGIAPGPCD